MGKLKGVELYWRVLIEKNIATDQELHLVTDILGYSKETLEQVLYARTAYRTFDQLFDHDFNQDLDEFYQIDKGE